MENDPRILLVFVDGLGLGEKDPTVNPLYRGDCPFLLDLLEREAQPVSATLDVPGLPQSATGQASLFTGENAAAFMGRHVEGCPGPTLRTLVEEHNVFDKLQARGFRCTFANGYYIDDVDEVRKRRRRSVTTVAAFKAFGTVRGKQALLGNRAVYQDLTRAVLRDRGYDGPLVEPEEAAEHLLAIARDHHFTVFEYFQTDIKAHRGTDEELGRVLSELDRFLSVVVPGCRGAGILFVLISDHGNLEDTRTRSHTLNPVPLVAVGPGSDALKRAVPRIEDLTPGLVSVLKESERTRDVV